MKPSQGHSFTNEITYIGNSRNPTCIICVNCSVTGDPPPVVTWEYQTNDNPGVFNSVVTNQSDPTSPYYVENNGQVSVTCIVNVIHAIIKLLVFAEVVL